MRGGVVMSVAGRGDTRAGRSTVARGALSLERLRALAISAAPALVVGCALVALAVVYYVRFNFGDRAWGGHAPSAVPVWLAFNDLGLNWASRIGDAAQAVPLTG